MNKEEQASVAKINKICKLILKLTPEDFEAVEDMAEQQASYIHPLKMATASKYHALGDHNKKVINLLSPLHKHLVDNNPPKRT